MWRTMGSKGFKLKANKYALSMLGKVVGMLIVKSYERADRVYQSMISKGYTGNPKTMVKFKMIAKDYALTFLLIGIAILPYISKVVL